MVLKATIGGRCYHFCILGSGWFSNFITKLVSSFGSTNLCGGLSCGRGLGTGHREAIASGLSERQRLVEKSDREAEPPSG